MSSEKYLESNRLTFQKLGLPNFVQQKIIVSDFEVDLARKCVLHLKQQIKSLCPLRYVSNEFKPLNPVWIPYQEYLSESLPSNKGPTMRTAAHVGSLLNIVALANSNLMVDFGIEKMVIARPEDLVEVLHITKELVNSNYTGVPLHKVKFLREIFIPVFNSKTEPDSNGDKQEKIIAVTTKELCDFYKKKRGSGITTDNLKKQYLNELLANDIIGEAVSELDKRQHVYYLLIDLEEEEVGNGSAAHLSLTEKITKLSNENRFDNLLPIPRVQLSKNYKEIPENWLILQILTLAKYRIDLENFKGCIADFLNGCEELVFSESTGANEQEGENGKGRSRLTVKQFISKYESNPAMSIRYIFKGHFYSFHSKIFGNMIGICITDNKQCKKLSNENRCDNLVISDMSAKTTTIAAATHNISLYSQILLKNIKNQGYSSSPADPIIENNSFYDHKNEQQQEENSLSHKFQSEAIAKIKEALPENKLNTFWVTFEELKNKSKVNFAFEETDKKEDTVNGRDLKQLLVAKCAFSDVGGS